jgi:multiple sugar transport system substrate-binding protein
VDSIQRSQALWESIDEFKAGRISRRQFVRRAVGLGVSMSVIGNVVNAIGARAQSAPNTDLTGTVRVYKGPFSADEVENQATMVASFNEKFPNVQVVVEQFEWPNQEAQVTASLAANAHDVYYTAEDKYHKFSPEGGPLLDLQSLVDAWDQKDKIQFWDTAKPRGSILAGVPYIWNIQSNLVLNNDIAEAAGADVNAITESYDGLLDAARKMTSDDLWGYVFRHGLPHDGQYDWQGFLFRNGADLVNEDWSAAAVNTPEAVAAIQWMGDVINKEKVSHPFGQYGWSAQRDLFSAGKIGLLTDEFTFYLILKNNPDITFNWSFLPYPPGTVNNHMLAFRGFLSIAKSSPNQEAAWELIKHYLDPAVMVPYLNDVGLASVRTDAAETGLFADQPELAQLMTDWAPLAQGPNPHPQSLSMVTVAEPYVESVYLGQSSAQDAMNLAAEEISALL